MTTHKLKIHPRPFADVLAGIKRAEFREVRDRNIQPGDYIVLQEYEHGSYTGYEKLVRVTHRQEGYGIPIGYAVLSIEVV